ncbi:transmembrane protein, putative, partial [Bodo saltans]
MSEEEVNDIPLQEIHKDSSPLLLRGGGGASDGVSSSTHTTVLSPSFASTSAGGVDINTAVGVADDGSKNRRKNPHHQAGGDISVTIADYVDNPSASLTGSSSRSARNGSAAMACNHLALAVLGFLALCSLCAIIGGGALLDSIAGFPFAHCSLLYGVGAGSV